MKSSILITTLMACALAAPLVSAQEKAAPTKPGMSMSMDKQMPQFQENMTKMQQQMEKIRATSDPVERKQLMQEHLQAMQENMQAMHGMGGPMMGGKKSGTTPADMTKRSEMMEKRMDMMQMMMEQMMQHDHAAESMPGK